MKKDAKKIKRCLQQLRNKENSLVGYKPPGYVSGQRMDQTRYGAFKTARELVLSGKSPVSIYWSRANYRYYVNPQKPLPKHKIIKVPE